MATVTGLVLLVLATQPVFLGRVGSEAGEDVGGNAGIFVWSGHYYAVAVMQQLGTLDQGGLVRIGFVHYNTVEEIDRLFDALIALNEN